MTHFSLESPVFSIKDNEVVERVLSDYLDKYIEIVQKDGYLTLALYIGKIHDSTLLDNNEKAHKWGIFHYSLLAGEKLLESFKTQQDANYKLEQQFIWNILNNGQETLYMYREYAEMALAERLQLKREESTE